MTAADMSTVGVLRRAKHALLDRGWYQGAYENESGSVCAVGALNLVTSGYTGDTVVWEEGLLLLEVIGADRPEDTDALIEQIATWNDQQISVEPVLAAFDRAIALAESEAS